MRRSLKSFYIYICMDTLREYGLGTNIHRLLQRYWEKQKEAPKSGKCFGRTFPMKRGVIQGDLVSLPIFNILVHALIRAVLLEVSGTEESQHGFGWVEGKHKFFYADNGRISGSIPSG